MISKLCLFQHGSVASERSVALTLDSSMLTDGDDEMARTYDDVMGPLRAADDDTARAQLAVFGRTYGLGRKVAAPCETHSLTQLRIRRVGFASFPER